MDSDSRPKTTFLRDYTPYPFKLNETRLEFFLDPKETRVITEIDIEPLARDDLVLFGEELRLIEIAIDGEELAFGNLSTEENRLVIDKSALPKAPFTLRTEVLISPIDNTALSGLYMSNGMYSTQCEAEGFRRITYYPDRPDVMTKFRVKIHADTSVRLSNGNLVNNKAKFTEWYDPWPKPAYLFALVAGELEVVEDQFTTQSGRNVDLKIYVRKGDEKRCDYAMDALKRSMSWDEKAYGREYDLDLFMIVAVDDFNMGAMENKGLNIFNSKLVLASPETATDADYAAIESVIAHEYFHNWTGNRITCRDWFQLSLKEGLTVYRDQQFSAHERSKDVQRIDDIARLRAHQFPEDDGPLAHPVRPESYIAIDNFYTATIYEKGAELIRMMNILVGDENYRKATDLYFERHDGEAATIEDWVKVFEDVTNRDFSQFKHWYRQAGRPKIIADINFTATSVSGKLTQIWPDAHDQAALMPLAYTIYNKDGEALQNGVLEIDALENDFEIEAMGASHISLNEGLSAPIDLEQTPFDLEFYAKYDQDLFNRSEAFLTLAEDAILASNETPYLEALSLMMSEKSLGDAEREILLALPNTNRLIQEDARRNGFADIQKIYVAKTALETMIAARLHDQILELYKRLRKEGKNTLTPEMASKRALALKLLGYLAKTDIEHAHEHFKKAKLMTDRIGALGILVKENQADEALESFYQKFKKDRLVIDKWFMVQASYTSPKKALETVKALCEHEAFSEPNPNRFRSLIGGFAAGNLTAFHGEDGAGYKFLADQLIEFDGRNPQIAARLSQAFQSWRLFDNSRQTKAKDELERILHANISPNLSEMVSRILG